MLRADPAAVHLGAASEIRGAAAVADTLTGRAHAAQPALVNGAAGAVWAPGKQPRVVFGFTITRGMVVAIDLVADPVRLRQLDLILDGGRAKPTTDVGMPHTGERRMVERRRRSARPRR